MVAVTSKNAEKRVPPVQRLSTNHPTVRPESSACAWVNAPKGRPNRLDVSVCRLLAVNGLILTV